MLELKTIQYCSDADIWNRYPVILFKDADPHHFNDDPDSSFNFLQPSKAPFGALKVPEFWLNVDPYVSSFSL